MSLAQVSVGTTAGGTTILADNRARRGVLIKALQSNSDIVWLKFDKTTTVLTAGNGYPLYAGESLALTADYGGAGLDMGYAILGLANSSTQTIAVQDI